MASVCRSSKHLQNFAKSFFLLRMHVPKLLIGVMLAAALIGFADSAYLTAQHFQGVIPPCTLEGCEQVLTSSYASIGPVPVSLLGSLYYGLLVILLIAYLDSGNHRMVRWARWIIG